MIDSILSGNKACFSDLYRNLSRGEIMRNCEFSFLDKLNNIKWAKSVVFINSVSVLQQALDCRIVGIITTKDIANCGTIPSSIGIWVDDNPEELFYLLHEHLAEIDFYFKRWPNDIAPTASVSPNVRLGSHSISIGEGCIIEDNVVIKPYTIVGKDSILRSSCDIGSDGFEAHRILGRLRIIKHAGLTVIGDNVEIQSLVTVSRGLFPSRNTILEDNVKIADLVHVAHGVQIGGGTMITAGCTIAGNTNIGSNVFIGPGAVITNRVTIADNAYISIGSVVVRNVKAGSKVSGNFAYDHQKMVSNYTKNLVD